MQKKMKQKQVCYFFLYQTKVILNESKRMNGWACTRGNIVRDPVWLQKYTTKTIQTKHKFPSNYINILLKI